MICLSHGSDPIHAVGSTFQLYPKADNVSPSPWLSLLSNITSCLDHCKNFLPESLSCSSCIPPACYLYSTQWDPIKWCIRSCDSYSRHHHHHGHLGSQSLQAYGKEDPTSPHPGRNKAWEATCADQRHVSGGDGYCRQTQAFLMPVFTSPPLSLCCDIQGSTHLHGSPR